MCFIYTSEQVQWLISVLEIKAQCRCIRKAEVKVSFPCISCFRINHQSVCIIWAASCCHFLCENSGLTAKQRRWRIVSSAAFETRAVGSCDAADLRHCVGPVVRRITARRNGPPHKSTCRRWVVLTVVPRIHEQKIRKFRTDKFDMWNKRFWLMQLM